MNSSDNGQQNVMAHSDSPTNVPSTIILIAYILIIAEAILHVGAMAISCMNFIVLTSIKLLHPNLKFILVCQSGAVFVFELIRLMTNLEKIFSNDIFTPNIVCLQMALLLLGYFRILTSHVLFIERLIASILVEKYESYKKKTFNFCWFSFTIILCFINVLTNGQSWTTTTLNVITMFFTLLLSLVECVFICIIGIYSKEKYRRQMENVQHIKSFLAARYQLAENMKTSKQLSPAFFCNFLTNLFGIVMPLNFVCKWITDVHFISMMISLYYIASSILNAIVEATIINHHPALKRRFNYLFNKFFRCHGGQVTNASVTTTIKSGNFAGDFEEHFKMIDLQWR